MNHYQLNHNENLNLFTANYSNSNDFDSLFSSSNTSSFTRTSSGTTLQSYLTSKQINTQNATTIKQSLSMPFNEINNNTLTSNLQKSIATNDVPNCTLFVGNLHPSINEHDLSELFKVFGIYQAPKCSKQWIHFGFVRYSTEKEAIQAYRALNGVKIKGRPMRLEFQNRTKKVTLNI
jgi:RNA recognition motif-containing protein